MKIFISMDMEGIPGTFNWDHESKDRSSVKRYIRTHLEDIINSIVTSKQNGLIDEIVIADSHSMGDNLDYEITALDERITLISGGPRATYMMPTLDDSFDHVFLVGYHAGTGALHGNMDHTYSNSKIQHISINGKAMNEALINAAYAGIMGVPVTLVTGDLALSRELQIDGALPWANFVTTKEGVAKFAAKNYNMLKVRTSVQDAVEKALSKNKLDYPLYKFSDPIILRIEFHSTSMADMACLMPETKRINGKTVEYRNHDYAVMFEALMALVSLAYTAGF
ncbi:MAG: hypothetical protein CVU48_05725 [Candidatus Cloacimonetes bacterium HGW-Cloacimonetes-1]|nr:MAG: hypothetical protein CVU48_05725 [Candidatus Cloacimonetes bacterium HGW-Cloacimonetes-1]